MDKFNQLTSNMPLTINAPLLRASVCAAKCHKFAQIVHTILFARLQRGATTVEYAVIIVLIILAVSTTVLLLVNPADHQNSLLPKTYDAVGNRVGNFSAIKLKPS